MIAREESAAARHATYRVRLRTIVHRIWRGVRLWGKWVWLNHWTEYDGEELRRKFGRKWSLELAQYQSYMRFEIVGVDEKGKEAPLSNWRLEELRRGEDIAAALVRQYEAGRRDKLEFEDVDAVVEELQRVRGLYTAGERPKRGETAHHLRDHPPVVAEHLIVAIMKRLSFTDAAPSKIGKWADNGRRRIEHEKRECRFCTHRKR
jgi:hypothetical protein